MTGDEFFNLKRGSNVTVETPFSRYKKGQVLKVEYIDSIHQQIYLRDTTKELGNQVKIVSTFFMLDFFVVGGKLPEKKNDKVLELPFKVGDKVWFIVDNEVHEGTLTKCNIAIDKNGTQICYNVLYYSRIHYKVEAKGIASNKLFKTKTELLASL
jgi:hypothetical protein